MKKTLILTMLCISLLAGYISTEFKFHFTIVGGWCEDNDEDENFAYADDTEGNRYFLDYNDREKDPTGSRFLIITTRNDREVKRVVQLGGDK